MGINPDLSAIINVKAGAKEIELVKLLRKFSATVSEAAGEYSPALVANYCYELSKEYNQFYHDFSILGEEDNSLRNFRLFLSKVTSEVLKSGMWLLGIEMPERM
jgi:arginyl-tRNA synthetase